MHAERRPLEYVCKPSTLALLIGAALALHPADGPRRTAFVVALVLSLAGDVFLMLPRDLFSAGLASFLLAHLAYIAGLLRERLSAPALVVTAIAAGAAAAVVGRRVLAGVVRSGHRSLLGPVVAYMAALAAMLVCAVGTLNPLAGAGAALFFCSDATLAWNRFVRPLRLGPVTVIVTYHAAQMLLVLSLLR